MVIARWLWSERTLSSRLVRGVLLPPSLVYRTVAAVRSAAYGNNLLRSRAVSVPTISVGNLAVGGSGKTPIAAWIASYCTRAGLRPGIVLRGYGGDEGAVHRSLVKDAIVVENANRIEAAYRAIAEGADVIVLDDAYQRLDIQRDLNIVLVGAESMDAPRWTLPSGPWRETFHALKRADLVVVTRKNAPRSAADVLVKHVERETDNCLTAMAHLVIGSFNHLLSGERVEVSLLSGADVVAAAGIHNPDSFAGQLRALGARVRLVRWTDHQKLTDRHLNEFARLSRDADFGVVTEKDAVKMRDRWPKGFDAPIVANLDVDWERGSENLQSALGAALAGGMR